MIDHVREFFDSNKYVHLTKIIPEEVCHFMTHYLLKEAEICREYPERDSGNNRYRIRTFEDIQSPGAFSIGHSIVTDTVSEILWPIVEKAIQQECIPTYSYARLYVNGNTLPPHVDRDSCEISVTAQLGRSHHYAWPIYIEGKRLDLGEGDIIIYRGCDASHWRDECKGPEGYYSGNVFCHYVLANGSRASLKGDKQWDKFFPFYKNRSLGMYSK